MSALNIECKVEPPPYPLQSILLGPDRFVVCEGGTKTGKTVATTLWQLQQFFGPSTGHRLPNGKLANGKHAWFGQQYSVAKISFERARDRLRPLEAQGLVKCTETPYPVIKGLGRCAGREWHFLTTETVSSIYGPEWQSIVVEEFTRHKPGVNEAIRTTAGPLLAPIRYIGNLTRKTHWGHTLARAVEKGELGTDWRYLHLSCWDAVDAGVVAREVVEKARDEAKRQGVHHIWVRDWECRFTDADQPFTDALLQRAQSTPLTGGPVALLLDAGGKQNPAGIVVLQAQSGADGGLCLSVPYAEHFLGDLTGFERRVDELVTKYRPAVITYDSYGGQLLERIAAKYPNAATQTSARASVLLAGLTIAREHMDAGRFAIGPDAQPLVDDLDYIGLDGDDVTVGTYQRDYWHEGQTIERPVHADAAVALLQGLSAAVGKLTSAANHSVRVHGTPIAQPATAAARAETVRTPRSGAAGRIMSSLR
jgi:hypothetical protein